MITFEVQVFSCQVDRIHISLCFLFSLPFTATVVVAFAVPTVLLASHLYTSTSAADAVRVTCTTELPLVFRGVSFSNKR